MRNKRKFLIGGIVIFLALGLLTVNGIRGAATYYYTVSELAQLGSSVNGKSVRVNGLVAPGSVEEQEGGRITSFAVVEGGKALPVLYKGVKPDTFKAGNEIVVEGRLDASGTFQAQTLMPKCPSKYEPKV
ncbi:MAG: cytochrome c-type biosis protein CcmE [Dehalococcoidales bacterium]|nr:cytochrome c-type biosis protein CcmE [Dehalococcoidales bacterium]